jgi:sugar/nucleoside kinase (ribokinase family)
MRTTLWQQPDGSAAERRVERGADLALRLDELPPRSVRAALTVVSSYSLSIEPARSAVLGALGTATARGGRSALLLDAELLWWTNARITRRVIEPALALTNTVALRTADAHLLFGDLSSRDILGRLADMGPRLIYLAEPDGGVLLRDGRRIHAIPGAADAQPKDRYAGPAAFWVGLARELAPQRAATESVHYAASARRPRL